MMACLKKAKSQGLIGGRDQGRRGADPVADPAVVPAIEGALEAVLAGAAGAEGDGALFLEQVEVAHRKDAGLDGVMAKAMARAMAKVMARAMAKVAKVAKVAKTGWGKVENWMVHSNDLEIGSALNVEQIISHSATLVFDVGWG